MEPDELDAALAQIRGQAATPGDDLDAALASIRKPAPTAKPEAASYAQQATGGVASLLRSVPGGEAAQSMVRAVVRGGGWRELFKDGLSPSGVAGGLARVAGSPAYREAREEIRDAEDTASPFVRNLNSAVGGLTAAAAAPGGMIRQGATYGGLNSLLDSDPDRGAWSRGAGAVGGAVVGGMIGAAGRVVGAIKNAPPGAVAKAAKDLIPARITRAIGRFDRAAKTLAPAPKVAPGEVVGEIAPVADDAVEAVAAPRVDKVVEAVKAPKAPWKPQRARGATKERDAYWAERMANRQSPGEVADMTDDQLLNLSLQHIQKGGTLQHLNAAKRGVRP